MSAAARELRAHGRPDAAQVLFERSTAWYRALAPGGPIADPRVGIAVTLYEAGQWQASREVVAALAEEWPQGMGYQGYLGVLAARLGDRTEAERVDTWLRDLERPYLYGSHTLWRARIAAVLGDHDRAVVLLREAFAEGLTHDVAWHVDVDLRPLRDHPPFRELMRPRG
jgi:hypothetical protein